MSAPIDDQFKGTPLQFSFEQLNSVRGQAEEELRELQRQLDTLSNAKQKFINARKSLIDLEDAKEDNFLYIPLTSSLYVPGKVVAPEKVIVELGTGYYCEKTVPEARALIERKIQLISHSAETIEKVGFQKKAALDQLMEIIKYKRQMMAYGAGGPK